jgi:hypothetical protein
MTAKEIKEKYPTIAAYKITENIALVELAITQVQYAGVMEEQLLGAIDRHKHIITLCTKVLQPVRDKFGIITITSGYRNEKVNQQVGGVKNSQHKEGKAADFKVTDLKNCYEWIKNELEFDQLIQYPTFIHVSYNTGNNRKQAFVK